MGSDDLKSRAICPARKRADERGQHSAVKTSGSDLGFCIKMALGCEPIRSKSGAEQLDPADVGTPRDTADAAFFLASDAARFMTGSEITVDGGRMGRL